MGENKKGFVMKSVDRALSILILLSCGKGEGMPLVKISRELGLNRSTCHHILSTLKARGFVVQDPNTRYYRLGIKTVEVGQAAIQQVDLIRVALLYMQELKHVVQENINLAVLERDNAVYVAQIPCDRTVRMFTRIGERAPLHCTGVGKVLLAYLSQEERASLLQRTGLPRFTAFTICDLTELERELAQIKEQGYARDWEEREREVACLAAPVWDYNNRVIAALSISAPTSRFAEERQRELLPHLLTAAAAISRELGAPEKAQGHL